MSVVSGESPMKALIADGQSLYASMKVYGNFMGWKTGVYSTLSGGAKGGHAMVAMGYGTEGSKPYWLLQNSWGPTGWGVDGYGKVLRGSNLAGIEDNAYWIKAWVEGGKQPACTDGASTGYTSGGASIPCSDAKSYGLCDPAYPTSRANCPKTCNSCINVGAPATAPGKGSKGSGGNAPAPTQPPPPPTPTPTTPAPASLSHCLKDATALFRNRYPCVVQNKCNQPVKMKCKRERCTQTVNPGYVLLSCNGKIQTQICTNPGKCTITAA